MIAFEAQVTDLRKLIYKLVLMAQVTDLRQLMIAFKAQVTDLRQQHQGTSHRLTQVDIQIGVNGTSHRLAPALTLNF